MMMQDHGCVIYFKILTPCYLWFNNMGIMQNYRADI